MRNPLWPTPEGEVLRLGKVTDLPVTESPEPDEQLLGQGPTDQAFLQTSGAKAFPVFTSYDHLSGGRFGFNTIAKVDIGTAGKRTSFLDSTGLFFFWFDGVLTGDMAVVGAGGLRSGLGEAADTLYAVFIIGDRTGVQPLAVFLDTSATAPVLPTGYNAFRRFGWANNNGLLDFIKFEQFGIGLDRSIVYEEEKSNLQVLTNGAAPAFTDVDLSRFVPVTARRGNVHFDFDPGAPNRFFRVRKNGSTITIPPFEITIGAVQLASNSHPFECDSAQLIEYEVSNVTDSLDLYVPSYIDTLEAA